MSDKQNKYYKIITNKHTSLIVYFVDINHQYDVKTIFFPVFGFVDSNITVYNYLCFLNTVQTAFTYRCRRTAPPSLKSSKRTITRER